MGGECILFALIFSGMHRWKPVLKHLGQPYLTKATASKFITSMWFCWFQVGSGFSFLKLNVFSVFYDKC